MPENNAQFIIELIAKSDDAKRNLDDAKKSVEDLGKAAEGTADRVDDASSKLDKAGASSTQLGTEARQGAEAVNQLGDELEGTGAEAEKATAAAKKTADEFDHMGKEARQAKSETRDFNDTIKGITEPTQKLQETISRVTTGLVLFKGAWDIGWQVGEFIRNVTLGTQTLDDAAKQLDLFQAKMDRVSKWNLDSELRVADFKRQDIQSRIPSAVKEDLPALDTELTSEGDRLSKAYRDAIGQLEAARAAFLKSANDAEKQGAEKVLSQADERAQALAERISRLEETRKALDERIKAAPTREQLAPYALRDLLPKGPSQESPLSDAGLAAAAQASLQRAQSLDRTKADLDKVNQLLEQHVDLLRQVAGVVGGQQAEQARVVDEIGRLRANQAELEARLNTAR